MRRKHQPNLYAPDLRPGDRVTWRRLDPRRRRRIDAVYPAIVVRPTRCRVTVDVITPIGEVVRRSVNPNNLTDPWPEVQHGDA